ncbi:MAG: exodeoxyribonuclease VII small subunit [Christensenellales bacterium]|jgi:exodeoxyribonuclease VII small subunit
MSLEEDIKRLDQIVADMDKEELTLDQSLNLFKEGIELAKKCATFLNEKKGELKVLDEQLKELEVELEEE